MTTVVYSDETNEEAPKNEEYPEKSDDVIVSIQNAQTSHEITAVSVISGEASDKSYSTQQVIQHLKVLPISETI